MIKLVWKEITSGKEKPALCEGCKTEQLVSTGKSVGCPVCDKERLEKDMAELQHRALP